MTRRCTLALRLLLLACGCAPAGEEDGVVVGAHVDLEIEAGLEPCGDLVGHMDRYVEAAAARMQVDLGDVRYTYRWTSEPTHILKSGCSAGSLGCAGVGVARSFVAPLDHELAHLVSFAVGRPPSFFVEGAAVAFEGPYYYAGSIGVGLPPGGWEVAPLLAVPRLEGPYYPLAGAYTRHLIDRFGMDAYLEFYAWPAWHGLEGISAVHEEVFGEPLVDTIAAFDAERRDCEHARFSLKLLECSAPPVAFDGDVLTLRRGLSCADDDVVGPFFNGRAMALASFEAPAAGLYELSAVSEGRVTITLGSCGGCEAMSPVEFDAFDGPRRISLVAGPHYLQLETTTTSDAALTLQLRRIE